MIFFHDFLSSAEFFKITFKKILSVCQTVLIQLDQGPRSFLTKNAIFFRSKKKKLNPHVRVSGDTKI